MRRSRKRAKGGTQGGYIVAATGPRLATGSLAPWSPAAWSSYRLRRAVGSIMAGETQVLLDALGHTEWLGCHLCEAIFSDFDLRDRSRFLRSLEPQYITDCKSVYDHLIGPGSPSGEEDKRCAVELALARETLRRIGCAVRWAPTERQLAVGGRADNRQGRAYRPVAGSHAALPLSGRRRAGNSCSRGPGERASQEWTSSA